MTNSEIVEKLEYAMSLMELMDANPFKVNAFRGVAQQIDKMTKAIRLLPDAERDALFTKSMGQNIQQILERESFTELDELEAQIPIGVRSMLLINGIGPKKVKVLWKEAGIESIPALRSACESGQVALLKGFGAKIQETVLNGIGFLESIRGKMLMHKASDLGNSLLASLKEAGFEKIELVGDLVMMSEVVSAIEFLLPTSGFSQVQDWILNQDKLELNLPDSSPFKLSAWHREKQIPIRFFFSNAENWQKNRYMLNTTHGHWQQAAMAGIPLYKTWVKGDYQHEKELYEKLGKAEIPIDLRIGAWEWAENATEKSEKLIQYRDLKGCVHNHSIYSDGKNTLSEMAEWCIGQGWEYFGIADHSKSAHYAQGLYEDKVEQQWTEIEKLNQNLAPFKILKGIESDILPDGSLDYSDDFLSGFDYVVASVHSGMKMDSQTATQRLIKAIENPHTTILGHCSGRILLQRAGYPLHYQKIIDACIANKVAIELNAHPARLDMDWQNLAHALDAGAIISINPDAHERQEMDLMRYGTYMARKAGASREQVLNSMTLNEILHYLNLKKGIIA